jgi:hypothetical protein
MRTPTWCRGKAAGIWLTCVAVIDELLTEIALSRLRAAHCVLGLADKHDPGRLEAACAKAIAARDPSYRTIKDILAAGTLSTSCHHRRSTTTRCSRRYARSICRGDVGSPRRPPRPGPRRRPRPPGVPPSPVPRRDLPPRDHRDRPAHPAGPGSGRPSPWKGSTSPPPRKRPAAQIRDLARLRWLQASESVIFYGLVLRLRHARAHPAQADDRYELINERAGRSPILTSNRTPVKAHLPARTCAR